MGSLFGMQDVNADKMTEKIEQMLPVIKRVNAQFRDKVGVHQCIPYLRMYYLQDPINQLELI